MGSKRSVWTRKPRKNKKYARKISTKRDAVTKQDDEERPAASTDGGELSGEEHDTEGCNTMVLQLDPGLLDCPICYEPLTFPIFQCSNGHFACSPCTKKLDGGKCPVCSLQAGHIRNLGLEHVAAGARIRCPFSSFGCGVVVSYDRMLAHEAACPCAPCSCPISGCDFHCAAPLLEAHIRLKHHADSSFHGFTYGRALTLRLRPEDSFLVLLGNAGDPVFLLARRNGGHNMPSGGVQIMVVCLQPTSSAGKWEYEYTVTVIGNRTALQLTTTAVSTTLWTGDFGDNSFLFVQPKLICPQNLLEVTLQIRKIKGSSLLN